MSYLQLVWLLSWDSLSPVAQPDFMLWSPLPPQALAVLPVVGKARGPVVAARSRNHVSCHYLHYLDWEQSVMSPFIITSLPGEAEKGGEEQEL